VKKVTIHRFTGAQLGAYLDAVARLRIAVFRDFPYLYDGTMEYERNYLQTYLRCPQAVVVVAFAGQEVGGGDPDDPATDDNHGRLIENHFGLL